MHEEKGKPPLPPKVGNIGKKRSFCLGSFHCYWEGGGGPGKACDSKLNDTTTMKTHIQSQCLKYPYREKGKNQSTLAFKPKEEGESSDRFFFFFFW